MSALSKGFENAGLLVVFLGFGWLLDRWLGTKPWMAVAMSVLGIVGMLARTWYAYDAEMREHEARRTQGLNHSRSAEQQAS